MESRNLGGVGLSALNGSAFEVFRSGMLGSKVEAETTSGSLLKELPVGGGLDVELLEANPRGGV